MTIKQQIALVKSIPKHRKMLIQKAFRRQAGGSLMKNFWQKVKKTLGVTFNKVAPFVLEKILIPLAMKKVGLGLFRKERGPPRSFAKYMVRKGGKRKKKRSALAQMDGRIVRPFGGAGNSGCCEGSGVRVGGYGAGGFEGSGLRLAGHR